MAQFGFRLSRQQFKEILFNHLLEFLLGRAFLFYHCNIRDELLYQLRLPLKKFDQGFVMKLKVMMDVVNIENIVYRFNRLNEV